MLNQHIAIMKNGRRAGTSLVELLVVIVIFLIGILAMLQIFPGGFKVLSTTRSNTMANGVAESEMDRLRAFANQLPEQIIPVVYVHSGTGVIVQADPTKSEFDLGPTGVAIDSTGQVLDASNNQLGPWQYLTGANNVRRVIGEGSTVPAPRAIGSDFGGLMVLQFGPIIYNAAQQSLFQVYGNDMERLEGAPGPAHTGDLVRPYQYFVDDTDPTNPSLFIPNDTTHKFKLAMIAYVMNAGQPVERQIVDAVIDQNTSDVDTAGSTTEYAKVPLHNKLAPGDTLRYVDYDSIRLARDFNQVTDFTGSPNDPYQYKLVGPSLQAGLIIFSPSGYNYTEKVVGGQRVPLTARVDYDVYDWRILKEDFRVPDTGPYQYRLRLTNIKHSFGVEPDGSAFQGLNITVPDERGGTDTHRDIIVMDLQTGGIYSKTAYIVDYSLGVITFKDINDNPADGLQIGLIAPGATSASSINAGGRSVRIFYEAVGEWSAQVLKAPSQYSLSSSASPGVAQFYPDPAGLTNTTSATSTLIYFPPMDSGKKVSIDEVWYKDAANATHVLRNQDFLIRAGTPFPSVQITDQVSGATMLDFTNGYAARGVKGASLTVRVLWNPASMHFGTDAVQNLSVFEDWGKNWRRTTTDTYLQRGVN